MTATRGLCASCLLRTALSLEDGAPGYRILTVIGGDADAVTYLAEPASGHERFVALKVLGPRRDVAEVLARYARWRPAFDSLQHPAIRRIIGAGRANESHCYIAAEYVTGPTLSTMRGVTLTAEQRIDIVAQLRQALTIAHQAGIAHLNLTASRVRIATSGSIGVKILGFETRTIVEGVAATSIDPDLAALELLAQGLHTPPATR
jgi:serine/threonine protein kinase